MEINNNKLMKHYIFTRWNLSDIGMSIYDTDKMFEAYGKKLDPEKWVEERIKLFEQYCLPSMINQTNKKVSIKFNT